MNNGANVNGLDWDMSDLMSASLYLKRRTISIYSPTAIPELSSCPKCMYLLYSLVTSQA